MDEELLREFLILVKDKKGMERRKVLWARDGDFEKFDSFEEVLKYAKIAGRLEKEFGQEIWDYLLGGS